MSDSSSEKILNTSNVKFKATLYAPTAYVKGNYARQWLEDALYEARNNDDHNGRRREIIFSVCFSESYLFEWVRDVILCKDITAINTYFRPGDFTPSADEKWKKVTKQLKKDNLIKNTPDLNQTFWTEYIKLLDHRHGLIHASASRPYNSGLPEKEKPTPGVSILHEMEAGYPTRVVMQLVKEFHCAAEITLPDWIQDP